MKSELGVADMVRQTAITRSENRRVGWLPFYALRCSKRYRQVSPRERQEPDRDGGSAVCSRLRGYRGNSSHPGVSIFNGEIRPGRVFKTNIYPASFAIRFFQVEGNKDEIYHRVVHAWWPVLTGRERSMWKPEGLEHEQNPPGLRKHISVQFHGV